MQAVEKKSMLSFFRWILLVSLLSTTVMICVYKSIATFKVLNYVQSTNDTSKNKYIEITETLLISIEKELLGLQNLAQVYSRNLNIGEFFVKSIQEKVHKKAEDGKNSTVTNNTLHEPNNTQGTTHISGPTSNLNVQSLLNSASPASVVPSSVAQTTTSSTGTIQSQEYFCTTNDVPTCANASAYEFFPLPSVTSFYLSLPLPITQFIPNYYIIFDGNQKLVSDKALIPESFEVNEITAANNASFNFMSRYIDESKAEDLTMFSSINIDMLYRVNASLTDAPLYYIVFPYPSFSESDLSVYENSVFFLPSSNIQAGNKSLNVSLSITKTSELKRTHNFIL